MAFDLNQTLNPISPEERRKINENWGRITSYLTSLQMQLKTISGGNDIDEIIDRILQATDDAESSIATMNQLINTVNSKITQIEAATSAANAATANATNIYNALVPLKTALEQLQTNLSGIVAAENARVTAEQDRTTAEGVRNTSEQSRGNAEQQRVQNENVRIANEQARVLSHNELLTLLANLGSVDYNPSDTYDFPTFVAYGGETYLALQEVTGITPTDDKVHYRLAARRGVDGTGAVSTVNGKSPDNAGNVLLNFDDVGAASKADFTQHLAQLTWYEAVLVNGFTGSIKYAKDTHGNVYIRLSIVNLATIDSGTLICNIPEGFRPNGDLPILVYSLNLTPFNNLAPFTILGSGDVKLTISNGFTTIGSEAYINGEVSYRAVL